jgi:hypothetical protein
LNLPASSAVTQRVSRRAVGTTARQRANPRHVTRNLAEH